jgi:hypothetical protein
MPFRNSVNSIKILIKLRRRRMKNAYEVFERKPEENLT